MCSRICEQEFAGTSSREHHTMHGQVPASLADVLSALLMVSLLPATGTHKRKRDADYWMVPADWTKDKAPLCSTTTSLCTGRKSPGAGDSPAAASVPPNGDRATPITTPLSPREGQTLHTPDRQGSAIY